MKLPIFQLEDYLAKWEFKAPYLLCCSDAESMEMKELLQMADDEALHLWNNLRLSYTEAAGLPLLRTEICHLYSTLSANHIYCLAGAEEGIFCTMNVLIQPGEHIIVVTPCYQSLEDLPKSLQAQVTTIPLDPVHWNLDLDRIKHALKPSTRMIVINFPHNPTGTVLDRSTLNDLVALARSQGAYLFSDEVYRHLESDESIRPPAIADLYEKGISLGVMSKAFGLAGLRIGWLASQDEAFLKKIADFKHYLSICNSAPSELLSLIALRSKETILQRNRSIMLSNLTLLDQFFERYASFFSWIRPQGGCVGFPKLLTGELVDDFTKELVLEEGVLLMPGSIYNDTNNHFRIGFGRKNMPEALQRLERFMKKRYG